MTRTFALASKLARFLRLMRGAPAALHAYESAGPAQRTPLEVLLLGDDASAIPRLEPEPGAALPAGLR